MKHHEPDQAIELFIQLVTELSPQLKTQLADNSHLIEQFNHELRNLQQTDIETQLKALAEQFRRSTEFTTLERNATSALNSALTGFIGKITTQAENTTNNLSKNITQLQTHLTTAINDTLQKSSIASSLKLVEKFDSNLHRAVAEIVDTTSTINNSYSERTKKLNWLILAAIGGICLTIGGVGGMLWGTQIGLTRNMDKQYIATAVQAKTELEYTASTATEKLQTTQKNYDRLKQRYGELLYEYNTNAKFLAEFPCTVGDQTYDSCPSKKFQRWKD